MSFVKRLLFGTLQILIYFVVDASARNGRGTYSASGELEPRWFWNSQGSKPGPQVFTLDGFVVGTNVSDTVNRFSTFPRISGCSYELLIDRCSCQAIPYAKVRLLCASLF